jgi:Fic-DOC domain mobile mystery protein B
VKRSNVFFVSGDGQTPLPSELYKGLRQKHIQNIGELNEAEENNFALGVSWLQNQKKNWIDVDFWKAFHKQCLNQVWDWAGRVRTHELDNDDFLRVWQINVGLKELELSLKLWLENQTEKPKEKAAWFHLRLLTIHPFANGNGRWSRLLTDYLSSKLNILTPTWGAEFKDDPKIRREKYIEAITNARALGNFSPLMEFMWGD